MATIGHLIKNLEEVDINNVIEESMNDTVGSFARLQRLQMLSGKNSEGRRIGRYKNAAYARKKYQLSRLAGYGNVDLRLTGDFYRGVTVDPRSNSVVIDSGDYKTEILTDKYGEEIFGLNQEYAGEYSVNYLSPVAVEKIKKQILK
jgi:hypothetical protein